MKFADVSYLPFRRPGKVVKSDYFLHQVCLSIRLSVRPKVLMEQLSYQITDFYENLYFVIFRRSVENIEISLKSDKNNGYLTTLRTWPPLCSNGQSFWLQIQGSRVRFPALPDFLCSSGSGTGSTQPREVNWGATWIKSSGSGPENRD